MLSRILVCSFVLIASIFFVVLTEAEDLAVPEAEDPHCSPGTQSHSASVARFEAFQSQIERLQPGDAVQGIHTAYEALTDGACYRFTDVRIRRPGFESAVSAIAWAEAGGMAWLRSFLDPIRNDAGASTVRIPPSERRVLTRESPGDFPLTNLLCSEQDPGCGVETREWIARANQAFREQRDREDTERRARWREHPDDDREPDRTPEEHIAHCGETTSDFRHAERYAAWYNCVHQAYPIYALLPLGRFRTPRRGWLVIRGRRGHYRFCDEVRAYDLATGAVHIASSCSGLVLHRGGLVDGQRTNAGRAQNLVSGRVPTDALREAALLIFLAPEVQRYLIPEAVHIEEIPAGLERAWVQRANAMGTSSGRMGDWSSSAQTTLRWSYFVEGRERAQGQLTWPRASHEGVNHAVSLLQNVESGLVQGCAPATIPPGLALSAERSGVSPIDANPARQTTRIQSLWQALVTQRAEPCPP